MRMFVFRLRGKTKGKVAYYGGGKWATVKFEIDHYCPYEDVFPIVETFCTYMKDLGYEVLDLRDNHRGNIFNPTQTISRQHSIQEGRKHKRGANAK